MKKALSYAAQTWGTYLVFMLVSVFFISSIGNNVLLTILDVALIVVFGFLIFNTGAYNGEKACTADATLEKQLKEGRRVDETLRDQGFSKKTGLQAFIICLLPFLIMSVVNLIVAPMIPEPEPTEVVEHEAFYQEDEDPDAEPQRINYMRVATTIVYMPYVFSFNLVSRPTLNWLFLLYAFIMPGCMYAGYMTGPAMRKKKLRDIALGKKRKQRNLKVHKPPKAPKAEV
ncbi:MAG: hypothetical protein IJJ23_05260 [Clostridia bacterium]|nr:hypothetical protein [Clostridia bacterium]